MCPSTIHIHPAGTPLEVNLSSVRSCSRICIPPFWREDASSRMEGSPTQRPPAGCVCRRREIGMQMMSKLESHESARERERREEPFSIQIGRRCQEESTKWRTAKMARIKKRSCLLSNAPRKRMVENYRNEGTIGRFNMVSLTLGAAEVASGWKEG